MLCGNKDFMRICFETINKKVKQDNSDKYFNEI